MVDVDNLEREYKLLKENYPGLYLSNYGDGKWVLLGALYFRATIEDEIIVDEYSVDILIPTAYPNESPSVKEVGGRIPLTFHTNPDQTLCLGLPISVKRSFIKNPTLMGFINNCLIPFLFAFSFKEKTGKMPIEEMAHGIEGLILGYMEEFKIKDIFVLLKFLSYLSSYNYPGFDFCPCHSGKRLFECHGDKLFELKQLQYPYQFDQDRRKINSFLKSRK